MAKFILRLDTMALIFMGLAILTYFVDAQINNELFWVYFIVANIWLVGSRIKGE